MAAAAEAASDSERWRLGALAALAGLVLVKPPIWGLVALAAAFYAIHELYLKRRRLPPGPTPIFVLGNMIEMALRPLDTTLAKWHSIYGSVFTIWIGPIPLVMVASLDAMKTYFVKHADNFSNRWRNYVTDSFMGGVNNGIVQVDGEKWREQRRFSLHTLRDFGVGRPLMEDKIMMHDEEFHALHSALDEQSRLVVSPLMGLYIAFPVSTNIPILNGPWKRLMRLRDRLWGFLHEIVTEHHDRFERGDYEVDDFTFAYMEEMRRREREEGESGHHFNEWQMRMLLLDLFFAGMETTVTTLKWACLLVVNHAEVQRKLHAEIDDILSDGQHDNGLLRLADRNRMPYTLATINEIQRIANILPINLLRETATDYEVDGYRFERGTLVIPQISILLNDPTHFPDPASFSPDRFLDYSPSGEMSLRRIDEHIPFSLGKRQCLGESLARAELFLIFSNLMAKFELSSVDGRPVPSKRILGLTVSPRPYFVKLCGRSTRKTTSHEEEEEESPLPSDANGNRVVVLLKMGQLREEAKDGGADNNNKRRTSTHA